MRAAKISRVIVYVHSFSSKPPAPARLFAQGWRLIANAEHAPCSAALTARDAIPLSVGVTKLLPIAMPVLARSRTTPSCALFGSANRLTAIIACPLPPAPYR